MSRFASSHALIFRPNGPVTHPSFSLAVAEPHASIAQPTHAQLPCTQLQDYPQWEVQNSAAEGAATGGMGQSAPSALEAQSEPGSASSQATVLG